MGIKTTGRTSHLKILFFFDILRICVITKYASNNYCASSNIELEKGGSHEQKIKFY